MLTSDDKLTRLEKGDFISYERATGRILAFRNTLPDHRLRWSSITRDNKSLVSIAEEDFPVFAQMIANACGAELIERRPENPEACIIFELV